MPVREKSMEHAWLRWLEIVQPVFFEKILWRTMHAGFGVGIKLREVLISTDGNANHSQKY